MQRRANHNVFALYAGVFAAFGIIFWVDRIWPLAGWWAIVVLSLTTGVVHGALDTYLLCRHKPWHRSLSVLTAYLACVLLLGWLLSGFIGVALCSLLLMSAWHFGEAYERWHSLHGAWLVLSRIVVGGAPVMLPILLSFEPLQALLNGLLPGYGLAAWRIMALVWLALLVVWAIGCGWPHRAALRHAWYELIATAVLFWWLSPLMAFALYFGVYHAPVHVWRVWRLWTREQGAWRLPASAVLAAVVLTVVLTWLLGAGLWWLLRTEFATQIDERLALGWLIVAFAALTAPHLVLINACADALSKTDAKKQ